MVSQEVLAALVGVLFTALGFIFWNNLAAHSEIKERLIVIETTINLMGLNAAKSLHSPHTPELDTLLEKYIDREYELTVDEWDALLHTCETIMEDKIESHGYRVNAAFLAAICHHKLAHDTSKIKPRPKLEQTTNE